MASGPLHGLWLWPHTWLTSLSLHTPALISSLCTHLSPHPAVPEVDLSLEVGPLAPSMQPGTQKVSRKPSRWTKGWTTGGRSTLAHGPWMTLLGIVSKRQAVRRQGPAMPPRGDQVCLQGGAASGELDLTERGGSRGLQQGGEGPWPRPWWLGAQRGGGQAQGRLRLGNRVRDRA